MTPTASAARLLPHEPPLTTANLTPVEGRIGPNHEDFRVEEIPAYLPCGTGEHRFVKVEKRGLSTPELVSIVARLAQVNERDIGYAGLKDKHAVTIQWLSLPRKSLAADKWTLPNSVNLLEESFHGNKLRTGHLHGNRFSIRLVDLAPDASARLPALLQTLKERGLLNAFGEQRFGRGGANIEAALEWLRHPRGLRGNKARFLSKLYPSVLQAEFFNRYLTLRAETGLDELLLGEIVRLEGTGSNFVVQDREAEQLRYARGELHPQGPMLGPKMRVAEAQARALEEELLREVALTEEQFAVLGQQAPGTRRDVRLWVPDLQTIHETLSQDESVLTLHFSLGSGSYATQVCRELTHSPWLGQHKLPTEEGNTEAIADADPGEP